MNSAPESREQASRECYRDELNFAEFPLASVSTSLPKGQKTLEFTDEIFDRARNERVTRKLTITASDKYGLPTAMDDEVILGLIQLTGKAEFSERKVFFTRYELLKLLGWTDDTRNYNRVEQSLNRRGTVAKLLNKLLIEQTKSRPRHCNDNGLVECKNGAVIRKHMGYGHIRAQEAEAIETFYEEHFNPYLNFHRPCGVPEQVVNEKGKVKRVYRWYATPLEILRQLPDVARYLKPDTTLQELNRTAGANTDTQAAREMQQAKRKLFAGFQKKTA